MLQACLLDIYHSMNSQNSFKRLINNQLHPIKLCTRMDNTQK
jgi:hypothetical protein